jgi:hypothetical protein
MRPPYHGNVWPRPAADDSPRYKRYKVGLRVAPQTKEGQQP